MPLPNDFRALGKAPMPPPGQGGSPLQISGNKLQENFEYLDRIFESGGSGGSGLPDGQAGDMLYHDGTDWVPLPAPSAPDTGKRWVMHHDGAAPEWVEYDEVTVNICIDGLPTEYTILGIPTP